MNPRVINMFIAFSVLLYAMLSSEQAVATPLPSSIVVWGSNINCGNALSFDLTNVANTMCGWYACVACKNDGTALV